jgi:hypothetical protein
MENEYIYNDAAYKHIAIHRKALVFDPRNTDNPIALDYLHTIRRHRDITPIYNKIINIKLKSMRIGPDIQVPISYEMILNEINLAWVDLIHQMIFIDQAYGTFYGEYKDIIEEIILHDTPDDKDTLVFRYPETGESVFHIAAKLWLLQKHNSNVNTINYNIDKELRYILECYTRIEQYFGNKRKYCILYMMDFNNNTLVDCLQSYVENILSHRHFGGDSE